MKRREFFEKAGIGSAALAGLSPAVGRQSADRKEDEGHDHGDQKDMEGALSSATVSFGQWNAGPLPTAPELDRFPNNSPRGNNNHQLIPKTVEIKAGGCVNFVISGFHYVLIYDDRTRPSDINISLTNLPTVLPPAPAPPGPPLINDPVNRIYRGLDPSIFPQLPGATGTASQTFQDRIEIVRFPNPGRFLVICGVLPHFFDPVTGEFIMYGYVRVRK
jgi:hypothetical protein